MYEVVLRHLMFTESSGLVSAFVDQFSGRQCLHSVYCATYAVKLYRIQIGILTTSSLKETVKYIE
jgi:hypothetical protein